MVGNDGAVLLRNDDFGAALADEVGLSTLDGAAISTGSGDGLRGGGGDGGLLCVQCFLEWIVGTHGQGLEIAFGGSPVVRGGRFLNDWACCACCW